MQLNIHPIIVHFPVAILTLYSVLELLRLPILKRWSPYFAIKAFLLIIGVGAAGVAGLSGKLAENGNTLPDFVARHQVVEKHSQFAVLTFLTFAILALGYVALIIKLNNKRLPSTLVNLAMPFATIAENGIIAIPLAIIGLGLLLVTGALGGIIVYGPNLDPFTTAVYNFFF